MIVWFQNQLAPDFSVIGNAMTTEFIPLQKPCQRLPQIK